MLTEIRILNFTFSYKFILDAVKYMVNECMNSGTISVNYSILGFVVTRTLHASIIVFDISYKNDVICRYDFDSDAYIEEEIDDIVEFIVSTFTMITRSHCETCSTPFFTTMELTHCTTCMDTLDSFDIMGPNDSTDKCCICLEDIGTHLVGSFDCGKHLGHIKCISQYKRSPISPQYSCPSRCDALLHDDDEEGNILVMLVPDSV
jgi:hypothetical protein